MMDKTFAIFSMGLLIAFMGVVCLFVGRPALIAVTTICLALGIYDFYLDLRKGGSHLGKE